MRIDLFTGELLVHRALLEVSMNTCSHNCAYCFANIKKAARYFKVKSFINSLSAGGLTGELLKRVVPVCLSNNTAPFAENNWIITEFVVGDMQQRGYRMMFQTKGGSNAYEILRSVHPSVIYVTITSDDDVVSRRV
jgi:DNA repair photolyase